MAFVPRLVSWPWWGLRRMLRGISLWQHVSELLRKQEGCVGLAQPGHAEQRKLGTQRWDRGCVRPPPLLLPLRNAGLCARLRVSESVVSLGTAPSYPGAGFLLQNSPVVSKAGQQS